MNDIPKSPPPRRDDFARSGDMVRKQREVIQAAATIARKPPSAESIARRGVMLTWSKRLLPAMALLLLGSIAVWPEINRMMNSNHAALNEAMRLRIESGNLLGATYRGIDAHGRPFMITSHTAHQIDQERIDLTSPAADTLSQGGAWLYVQSENGVFMQHAQTLDLTGEVSLYRDDGMMMRGPVADIDVKQAIIASDSWVHVEGPFGELDAKGYWVAQHEGIAQFRGPGRLILNDDRASARDKAS